MPASLQSPADVVNASLVRIGYKLRLGSLYDGSMAAKRALDIYSQTRDEILRQNDWQFAERNVQLTLLKQAPPTGYVLGWTSAYPPLPWIFQYDWPQDCIKIRSLKSSPAFIPNFDPQPNIYGLANDNSYTPAAKVILCNVPSAILTYTGQITDPSVWEADFTESLCAALGRRLAPVLVGLDAAKLGAQDEQAAMNVAETEEG